MLHRHRKRRRGHQSGCRPACCLETPRPYRWVGIAAGTGKVDRQSLHGFTFASSWSREVEWPLSLGKTALPAPHSGQRLAEFMQPRGKMHGDRRLPYPALGIGNHNNHKSEIKTETESWQAIFQPRHHVSLLTHRSASTASRRPSTAQARRQATETGVRLARLRAA